MHGEKLELCKKTIQFLIGELSVNDRLALVTYDTHVKTEFSLMNMDEKGKQITECILQKIQAGSNTNLSGGLFRGIEEIQKKVEGQDPNPVRSVLILTDGLANSGVTSARRIVEIMSASLEPGVSVFTFGYGLDHNAGMLCKISEVGGGLYYFVQSVDGVSLAFANCLGGLLSVVAQNIQIELFGMNGCKIESIKTKKSTKAIVPNKHYQIEMGDLYGDEARDVLIEVSMPTLPAANEEFVVLHCKLNYVNVLDSSLAKGEAFGAVQRLNQVSADQVPNSHVTEQRSRIIAAEALEQANAVAKRGRLAEGTVVLESALVQLIDSERFLNTTRSRSSVASLVGDLKECRASLSSTSMYQQSGQKRMSAKAQSHHNQRSNDLSFDEMSSPYQSPKKKYMMARANRSSYTI